MTRLDHVYLLVFICIIKSQLLILVKILKPEKHSTQGFLNTCFMLRGIKKPSSSPSPKKRNQAFVNAEHIQIHLATSQALAIVKLLQVLKVAIPFCPEHRTLILKCSECEWTMLMTFLLFSSVESCRWRRDSLYFYSR